MMRALALLDRDGDTGWIGDHVRDRGYVLTAVHRSPNESPPPLASFDLVLSFGSTWSVTDADRIWWIGQEMRLLRDASDLGMPVLGICFGAQLLAKALGGDVRRARRPEIGWINAGTRDSEVIPDTRWFAWHYDVFELPAAARLLAANLCSVQAYAAGHSMGVQFHPEVTPRMARDWATKGQHRLAAVGIDAMAMLEESAARAPSARAACGRLFDAFMALAEG
jgi:GMP synthase-like glutamine amidotransferase